ncbi:MAG: SGNH/GDSL hydrolase family protein, partial [Planctomycetota bacterium]
MKAAVRHALDGLLGLAVSALFLASVEGFLRWTQPEGETAQVSLSRGFDEEAAYLVPDPEVEGGFLTQYSDGRFPEKRFAPASDRRRVVLVGGSNTASFGTHYLQRALDERAGAGVFEVCNLGREGYGSERVRIVTQQALEQLDPDLVIVYSGHNEFVERGFRIDLDRAWEGELQTRVGDLAQRSRIISLLADRLRPKEWKEGAEDSSTEPEGSVPERHRDEYKKFAGLAWETTLDYYEAYRKNLLSIGHSCAERGVDVLYCSVVYNRFAAPFESTLRPEISSADRAEHARLRTEIEALLPLPLRRLSPEEGWEHLFHYDWIRGKGHKAPVDFPGLRPLQGVLGSTDPLLPEPKPKTRRHYRALEFLFTPLARTPEETEP